MKRTLGVLIGLGIVGGLGYVLLTQGSTMTVTNEPATSATSTVDAVPEPTAAELLEQATQQLIDEAIAASSTEIEAAKVAAASEVEAQMELEIERAVRAKLQTDNGARLEAIDKVTGAYWREVGNLKQEVARAAQKYGVSAYVMNGIINCESQWNTVVQSKHRYHAGNVPPGYRVGDREQSFGLVQIHLPAHDVSYEQAIDPEFSIEFLAKNIAAGKASWWTCYKQLAQR